MHSHLRQEIRTVSIDNCESSSGVEHHLAKVGVAGSNPVFRSNTKRFQGSSGGIGRHAGLKIQWTVRSVWVQVPSRVLKGTNLFLRFVPFLFLLFPLFNKLCTKHSKKKKKGKRWVHSYHCLIILKDCVLLFSVFI